jgi:dTDP-4-dehydrorhamnose 3,5-epimerase
MRKAKGQTMRFTETKIRGAWVIDPDPREDGRGRFLRAWCAREFEAHGIGFTPVQANMAYSRLMGTVRGLHFQRAPVAEAKLVRCTRGSIYDVVLDLRPGSSTFRDWLAVELSAENARMLFVPEGCAHGCQTLEDHTEIHYITSGYYAPGLASGARFDDPAFGILWPRAVTAISDQDRSWPLFEQKETGTK